MKKSIYKLQAVKDFPGYFQAGERINCFGTHWIVEFHTGVDHLFFLIWTKDGWKFVEKCFFRPIGKVDQESCPPAPAKNEMKEIANDPRN